MKIQQNISLKNKNTLGIHCQAEFYVEVESENDWDEVFAWIQEISPSPSLKKRGIENIRVLGLGSNILLPDGELPGLTIVLKNNHCTVLDKKNRDTAQVKIGAGALLSAVIIQLSNLGIDLSPLAGFPSTIGGAVRGNAGLKGVALGDFLLEATIIDLKTGEKELWKKDDFHFSYRSSELKKHPNKIFWEGVFEIPKSQESPEKFSDIIRKRSETQPYGNSSGCFFKNPVNDKNNPEKFAAGYLIDQCGLKGKQIGGAKISEKHANFFMNAGGASQQDFLELISFSQNEVRKKFEIELELEIQVM
ncbi:UDP-N-acetylmuramate dehydrogenase [Candidatus Peregrinibacteria bacterium]|nr:UDP-N-acetylmuramate dehydrogenase [Candidatus Peregrinibacteria bacterium]